MEMTRKGRELPKSVKALKNNMKNIGCKKKGTLKKPKKTLKANFFLDIALSTGLYKCILCKKPPTSRNFYKYDTIKFNEERNGFVFDVKGPEGYICKKCLKEKIIKLKYYQIGKSNLFYNILDNNDRLFLLDDPFNTCKRIVYFKIEKVLGSVKIDDNFMIIQSKKLILEPEEYEMLEKEDIVKSFKNKKR